MRKRKWLEVADRYPSLAPQEQQRIAERMVEWTHLTPIERAQTRLNFERAKRLAPQERQTHWKAYKALPEAQRRALQSRAAHKSTGAQASGASHAVPASARAASAPAVRAISPTMVQVSPGATTKLMTHKPIEPLALKPGPARITTDPGEVDPKTLLPRVGPQAAVRPASPASSP